MTGAARYQVQLSNRAAAWPSAWRGRLGARLSEPQRPARGPVARARHLRLPARRARAGRSRPWCSAPSVSSAITSRCCTTSITKRPQVCRELGCRWRAPQAVNDDPAFLDMIGGRGAADLEPLRARRAAGDRAPSARARRRSASGASTRTCEARRIRTVRVRTSDVKQKGRLLDNQQPPLLRLCPEPTAQSP